MMQALKIAATGMHAQQVFLTPTSEKRGFQTQGGDTPHPAQTNSLCELGLRGATQGGF